MNREWNVVGKNTPRLESAAKVTGKARYTDDYSPAGMVYGAVLRSPHPRAKVISIDASKARALPGVLAVLLPDEVEHIRYNCSGNPPSALLRIDEKILTDTPLHEGDRIAAVAAATPELCAKALELIAVEYEILPPILSIDAALAPGAALLHADISESNDFALLSFDEGDIDEGFALSDIILEDNFEVPAVHPLPLEPTGCICDWNNDGITIYSTSQTLFQERRLLAEMFGLPEARVRIVKPLMGGGFGARQQLHHQPVGCMLSKKALRPVKMILTREEEMLATTSRHYAKMRLRVGSDNKGKIIAFDAEVYHDTGAYCTHGPVILAAQGKKTPYGVKHYRYRGHCVYTNNLPAGAMRGYGNPQLTFAREVMVDRLARKLGMDPVELRLKNHVAAGDFIPGTQTLITSCNIESCAAEAMRIREKIETVAATAQKTPGVWGTAFCMHTSGPSNKSGLSSASIYVNRDGSVQLNLGAADIGQGSDTSLAQVAAEVLGIPLSLINVHSADTQSTPYDTGTFASSQMFVGGNAVVLAARDTIQNLTRALACVKATGNTENISEGEIKFDGGIFTLGNETLTFEQAAKLVLFAERGRVIFGEGSYKAVEAPPVFAVCMVRATFDELSGGVTVTDIIETVDAGTVINQNIVKGQIEGGIAQGLGYGWMEALQNDPRTGKKFTSDMLLYKIPTPRDMPRLHAASVPSYDPYGPLGAKSVGELTLVPVAAALAVCVERATGEQVAELPLSTRFLLEVNGEEDTLC